MIICYLSGAYAENAAILLVSGLSSLISLADVLELYRHLASVKKFNSEVKARFATQTTSISVLVPARNEEKHIEECLVSILEQDYPNFEVIAIDDNSSDATPQILSKLLTRYGDKLKIVQAHEPAPGWLGKSSALWQGMAKVNPKSTKILFVDADTTLRPGTLSYALNYMCAQKLDLFSLVPNTANHKDFWPEPYRTSFCWLNPTHSIQLTR